MNAPIRWKDDASFLAETGLDLADEGAGVGNYALDSMRSGVLVHTGRSWMAKAAPWIGGSVVVLVVAWLAWPGSPQPIVAAALSEAPSEVIPAAVPGIAETPKQLRPVAALVAPAKIASSPERVVDAKSQVSPLSPPMAVVAPPIAPPGEAEEVPEVAASDLAQQLDVYRQGQTALQSGDLSAAAESFQRYLETWPEGQVRDEVLVSVLEIVIQRQQWSQVQTLAGQLEDVPALRSRHQEFRRVRAEALSQIDRCPEALKLVESLSRPDAQAVKQRCRRAP